MKSSLHSLVLPFLLNLNSVSSASPGTCIANQDINTQFANLITGGDTYEVPDDSCCQFEICGLPCPEEVSEPAAGISNSSFIFAYAIFGIFS